MANFNEVDKAIDNREVDKVKRFLAQGNRPSERPLGNCFHIVLSQAWCAEWKVEMINILAEAGENINYRPGMVNGTFTGSPLFMATLYNTIHNDVLKAMFQNGANDDRHRFRSVNGIANDWRPV